MGVPRPAGCASPVMSRRDADTRRHARPRRRGAALTRSLRNLRPRRTSLRTPEAGIGGLDRRRDRHRADPGHPRPMAGTITLRFPTAPMRRPSFPRHGLPSRLTLRTLPADATPSAPHRPRLSLQHQGRRGPLEDASTSIRHGRSRSADDPVSPSGPLQSPRQLAHCGAVPTVHANALGGLDRARWFAGAPNPSGDGDIPAISPRRPFVVRGRDRSLSQRQEFTSGVSTSPAARCAPSSKAWRGCQRKTGRPSRPMSGRNLCPSSDPAFIFLKVLRGRPGTGRGQRPPVRPSPVRPRPSLSRRAARSRAKSSPAW